MLPIPSVAQNHLRNDSSTTFTPAPPQIIEKTIMRNDPEINIKMEKIE